MRDEHLEKGIEIGLGLFGALLLGGLGLLGLGRLAGDAQRRKRYGEEPPLGGLVPPERHQNVATSSPR
jgi:hypothetical protein